MKATHLTIGQNKSIVPTAKTSQIGMVLLPLNFMFSSTEGWELRDQKREWSILQCYTAD